MRLFDLLSRAQDVACVTVNFRQNGDHQVTVRRESTAPRWLDGPVLDAALFLFYAAKALHALGSNAAATELLQRLALSAITLSADRFEPFTSLIDEPGRCTGELRIDRSGALYIQTHFDVPLVNTNDYVLDTVLMMFSHAVDRQPTPHHRKSLVDSVQILERYYQTIADSASLKARRLAPMAAFEHYREGVP